MHLQLSLSKTIHKNNCQFQENNALNSATLPRARNRTESIEQQASIVTAGTTSDLELSKLSTSNSELGRYNHQQLAGSGQQLHITTSGTPTVTHHQQPVHSQLSAGSSSGGEQRPSSVVGSLFGSSKSRGINTRRRTQNMKQWSELKGIDMNGFVFYKSTLKLIQMF